MTLKRLKIAFVLAALGMAPLISIGPCDVYATPTYGYGDYYNDDGFVLDIYVEDDYCCDDYYYDEYYYEESWWDFW